jgi:C4-dicarboxylate-specific signal transduction histidine kinase
MNTASFSRHEIDIVRDYQEIPPVEVDKHKVLQILINLITNARQAMKGQEVKTLTLRIHASATAVCIAVADTGCGISPEHMTLMFGHGFTTKAEGHGFGLHSSALAAKEMKGSLNVQSDGPGRGATFTLELPTATSQRRAA